MQNSELIENAVRAITPMVTNETHAWNLWNFLNTEPTFILAFERLHGINSAAAQESIQDAVWEKLEDALEGPLNLDLNEPDQNVKFQLLVKEITEKVVSNLSRDFGKP